MYSFLKNNNVFLISIGAIPAAIFRWQIDQIFIVNIIGCFFLGFVNALPISRKYKLIFGFGFCGSLTTFSGWSFQLFELISQGLYKLFFLNVIAVVLMGFFSVFLGHLLANNLKD
tara:strand:- start:1059 stop:1403 length:345 start_codon:yes stop_codon:yes gene_type:complete